MSVPSHKAAVTFGPGVNGGRAVHIDNRNDEHNFVEVNTPIGSIFDQAKFSVVGWAKNEKVREVGGGDNWNSPRRTTNSSLDSH